MRKKSIKAKEEPVSGTAVKISASPTEGQMEFPRRRIPKRSMTTKFNSIQEYKNAQEKKADPSSLENLKKAIENSFQEMNVMNGTGSSKRVQQESQFNPKIQSGKLVKHKRESSVEIKKYSIQTEESKPKTKQSKLKRAETQLIEKEEPEEKDDQKSEGHKDKVSFEKKLASLQKSGKGNGYIKSNASINSRSKSPPRVIRADSIQLAQVLSDQGEDISPTIQRNVNIPPGTPNYSKQTILKSNYANSGRYFSPQLSQNVQHINQQQQQLLQGGIVSDKMKSFVGRQQQTASHSIVGGVTHQNLMNENNANFFREFVIGSPNKVGLQIASQPNILSQIAVKCQEDVRIRLLETNQDQYVFDLKRAHQFLFADKDKEEEQRITDNTENQLSVKTILLNKSDREIVDEFYASLVESSQKQAITQMIIVLLICIIKTLSLSVLFGVNDQSQSEVGINMGLRVVIICCLVLFIVHSSKFIHSEVMEQFQLVSIITCTLYGCLIGLTGYEILQYDHDFIPVQFLEQMLYFIIFTNLAYMKRNFLFGLISFTTIVVPLELSLADFNKFSCYYFFFACCFFHFVKRFMLMSVMIQNYNTMRVLDRKKSQKDSLVKNLIPRHILDFFNVKSIAQQADLSDIFEDATLLYADITDFTKYCSQRNPEEVVNMLSNLFLKFDIKCQALKCFKVYTIGDCYVVLGVDNAKERNPALEAHNVVTMAFNMLDIIQVVRKEVQFETLNMRIGIHTGQVIGGITGSDIVRYDIYGTDVMIANKMESNGEPGCIMVSEVTKNLLESAYGSLYSFSKGAKVQDIQGYFISSKADEQSSSNSNQNLQYEGNLINGEGGEEEDDEDQDEEEDSEASKEKRWAVLNGSKGESQYQIQTLNQMDKIHEMIIHPFTDEVIDENRVFDLAPLPTFMNTLEDGALIKNVVSERQISEE